MQKDLNTLNFLYASLKEAQDNIRTYDTKAQIVGIGFIFTIGTITKLTHLELLENQSGVLILVLSWALIMVPLITFVSVLYPTRKMAPSILRGRREVQALFYLHPNEVKSLNEYVSQLEKIDIMRELTYELMKVSILRELKRKRFLRAIFVSSLSLLFLLFFQVYPLLSLF